MNENSVATNIDVIIPEEGNLTLSFITEEAVFSNASFTADCYVIVLRTVTDEEYYFVDRFTVYESARETFDLLEKHHHYLEQAINPLFISMIHSKVHADKPPTWSIVETMFSLKDVRCPVRYSLSQMSGLSDAYLFVGSGTALSEIARLDLVPPLGLHMSDANARRKELLSNPELCDEQKPFLGQFANTDADLTIYFDVAVSGNKVHPMVNLLMTEDDMNAMTDSPPPDEKEMDTKGHRQWVVSTVTSYIAAELDDAMSIDYLVANFERAFTPEEGDLLVRWDNLTPLNHITDITNLLTDGFMVNVFIAESAETKSVDYRAQLTYPMGYYLKKAAERVSELNRPSVLD